MPFQPVRATISAELRFTQDNQKVENIVYFYFDAGVGAAEVELVATGLIPWWRNEIQPLQHTSVALREVYARDLSEDPSFEYTASGDLTDVGEKTGNALPNADTLAISFRSGLTGRSTRGRNFIVGLTEADVSANNVAAAVAAAWVAAYNSLKTLFAAEGGEWVVVSRETGGAPRLEGVVFPITGVLVVDTVVDAQRRRLPGRGE